MVSKNQLVFNTMVLHLYNQGEQCASKPGHCVYRKGNKRCVFGALIPDSILDKLTPRQKNLNASSMIESSKELQQLFEGVSVRLLTDMQYWHDSMEVVNERGGDLRFVLHKMEKTLRRVAEAHGLNTAVFSPHIDNDKDCYTMNYGQTPPHAGWWHTTRHGPFFTQGNVRGWRYWDGDSWSHVALPSDDPDIAAETAKYKNKDKTRIAFSYYWPENARVPRLNPEVPQWTT